MIGINNIILLSGTETNSSGREDLFNLIIEIYGWLNDFLTPILDATFPWARTFQSWLDNVYNILIGFWNFVQYLISASTTLVQVVIQNIDLPTELSGLLFPLLGSAVLISGLLMIIKLLLGR